MSAQENRIVSRKKSSYHTHLGRLKPGEQKAFDLSMLGVVKRAVYYYNRTTGRYRGYEAVLQGTDTSLIVSIVDVAEKRKKEVHRQELQKELDKQAELIAFLEAEREKFISYVETFDATIRIMREYYERDKKSLVKITP